MESSVLKKYMIMVTNLNIQAIINLILALFAMKHVEMESKQPTKSVIMEES